MPRKIPNNTQTTFAPASQRPLPFYKENLDTKEKDANTNNQVGIWLTWTITDSIGNCTGWETLHVSSFIPFHLYFIKYKRQEVGLIQWEWANIFNPLFRNVSLTIATRVHCFDGLLQLSQSVPIHVQNLVGEKKRKRGGKCWIIPGISIKNILLYNKHKREGYIDSSV